MILLTLVLRWMNLGAAAPVVSAVVVRGVTEVLTHPEATGVVDVVANATGTTEVLPLVVRGNAVVIR